MTHAGVSATARPAPSGEVPPSSPAPPRFYRPELDCLRAVAFLMVFTSHIPALPGAGPLLLLVEESGSAGVCVFFTLSAYLITELLLREQSSAGTIHRAAFYLRRILRIWPLYFLAITLSVLGAHIYHRWTAHPRFVLPYLALSGNIATSLRGAYPRNGLLAPLWSISVEEQFYLAWPLLLRWRNRSGIRVAIAILLPLAWGADIFMPLHGSSRDPGLWTNSLNQFQYFALGALIALLLHARSLALSRSIRVVLAVAAAIFFSLAGQPLHFLFDVGPARPLPMLLAYLCIDVACVCMLLAFLGAPVPRWADPLRRLGRISYGTYVYHFVIWIGMAAVCTRVLHLPLRPLLPALYLIVLAITIATASISYRYFEKPFLRLKDRLAFIPTRPA